MKQSDIKVTQLKRIETPGGDVLHGMKRTDEQFLGFGEAYFSWVSAGTVKAWKRHTEMVMNVMVPVGQVRFVFCSSNVPDAGHFRIEDIGEERYVRLTVPPKLWFGFQGIGLKDSLVVNIANIPHDPNEVERCAPSDINYDWN